MTRHDHPNALARALRHFFAGYAADARSQPAYRPQLPRRLRAAVPVSRGTRARHVDLDVATSIQAA